MKIDWHDSDWPFLLWVNPNTPTPELAEVDADQCDLIHLGWRSRALLRASLQRTLTRLDTTEPEAPCRTYVLVTGDAAPPA